MSSSPPTPAQVSGDATDDQTGRFVPQPNGRVRPLSPHLQVWRFHVTMTASILHRITGGALFFGMLVVVAWALAAAFGPEAYGLFGDLAGSPLGLVVWFGLSLCLVYHLISGVRHLIWDTGAGLSPRTASLLASVCLYGSVVLTLAFWAALFLTGKVSL